MEEKIVAESLLKETLVNTYMDIYFDLSREEQEFVDWLFWALDLREA